MVFAVAKNSTLNLFCNAVTKNLNVFEISVPTGSLSVASLVSTFIFASGVLLWIFQEVFASLWYPLVCTVLS